MSDIKYEILENDFKINIFGVKLFRIKSRKKIECHGVEPGQLGGWVSNPDALDHSDEAWVSDEAQVSGEARVYGKALVSGEALVSGKAQVYGKALVSGKAQVYGEACVYGEARVYGEAWVYGEAKCTSTAINIIGTKYNITIADDHVMWGCKIFKFDEVDKLLLSECESSWSSEEFENCKIIINLLISTYRRIK